MMQSFQEEGFDPREWINKELEGAEGGAPLEAVVHGLSLKLQVLGNEVNTAFEEQIIQTLAKLPMGLIDLERIDKEAVQLSSSLTNILDPEIIEKQQAADTAVQRISDLHETKTKLDTCHSTLSKTVYLRTNVHQMKKAFEKGDTAMIASEISKMQQALEAIKGYEHYDELSKTIISYEARLQEMVEVECVDALLNRDILKAQQHLTTLRKIGRLGEIIVQYTKRAVVPVVEEWKQFAKTTDTATPGWEVTFLTFLPQFNAQVEHSMGKSKKYYSEVFGEDCSRILIEWFMMLQRELAHNFSKYYSALSLPGLVKAYQSTMALATSIKENHVKEASPDQSVMLDQAALGPFMHLQRTYPELEVEHLLKTIAQFRFVSELSSGSTVTINPMLVSDITDTTTQLIHECQTSIERCLIFSPDHALDLAQRLNDVMSSFSARILEVVQKLRVALQLDPSHKMKEKYAAEDPVKLKLTLQLYATASGMKAKVKLFQVWLEEVAAKHAVLRGLPETVFAVTEEQLELLAKESETIVFDLLFEAVEARFKPLPELPVWEQQEGSPASMHFAGSTPLDAIRQTGEYLLSLPEALGQVSDINDDDDEQNWIMDILNRVAAHYTNQVLAIPYLSNTGMKQLSTDIEYLVNVMWAFNVEMPNLKALLILTNSQEEDPISCLEEAKEVYEGAAKLHEQLSLKRQPPPPAAARSHSSTGKRD